MTDQLIAILICPPFYPSLPSLPPSFLAYPLPAPMHISCSRLFHSSSPSFPPSFPPSFSSPPPKKARISFLERGNGRRRGWVSGGREGGREGGRKGGRGAPKFSYLKGTVGATTIWKIPCERSNGDGEDQSSFPFLHPSLPPSLPSFPIYSHKVFSRLLLRVVPSSLLPIFPPSFLPPLSTHTKPLQRCS